MSNIRISFLIKVLLVTIILCGSFVSCSQNKGNEPTKLTTSQVTKLVNSYLKEHKVSPAYTSFRVGRFRLDDKDVRETYRKLDAAGVINLKIDTTVVSRTVKTGTNYWTGRAEYATKKQTIYTLTTELTEATRKYLVETNPFTSNSDPDMEQPTIGDFPEFHLDEVIFDTPEIEEGEEASKVVYAKGTDISLVKVRNISIDPKSKDSASFECILQNGTVTPAYRVINKEYDNQKTLIHGTLKFYLDKGWTVTNMSGK